MDKQFFLDFETEAIQARPVYPPKPVGVSLKEPGKKSKYWAWGHPTNNNCTKEQASREIKRLLKLYRGFICHNLKFDYDVLATFFPEIQLPDILACGDTMLLGFLDDPHSRQLKLKVMSVKYLGREPKEQEELKRWILDNVPEARRAKSKWGEFICKAPGSLVAPYAEADTDMTAGIHKILHKKVLGAGMLPPYERELRLIPILLANERQGIRVDLSQLEQDVPIYEKALTRVDDWLRKYLNAPPDLNIDADQQVADALESAGIVTEWIYTAPDKNGKGGGSRSMSKKALAEMVEDKLLLAVLEYRGSLTTFTRTFLTSWRDIARETDGWVYTTWNSTAQPEGGGTRTGRLSSSKPTNFMNIPSGERYEELIAKLTSAGLFKKLKWLPALPKCRRYVIADSKNHVICGFDWSAQEPRSLAHFEDGKLCKAYNENPRLDVYIFALEEILKITGKKLTRKQTKTLVLALLYGIGNQELANRLECSYDEAKQFKDAFLGVFPDIRELLKDLKDLAKANEPMRTWGGRLYYCEEPRAIKGVLREFSYKLINYLCQGSCADMAKEAIIRYSELKKQSRLLLTVHDEIAISSPKKSAKQEMKFLETAMTTLEIDVPLPVDGYIGDNWGDLKNG